MSASRLHVAVEGSLQDDPVVFLHGFMGSHRDWSHVIARLDDESCCIAVDLPGHGESTGLDYPEDYTDKGIARCLIEAIDAVGIDRFHLVGYSMGGRAAYRLALDHADRVKRLVIESASPGLILENERHARRQADERWVSKLRSMTMAGFIEEWYRQPLFDSLRSRGGIYREIVEHRQYNQPEELIRSLNTMGVAEQESMWDDLPRLTPETLLVSGELDKKYRVIANRVKGLCPRAQTAIVPGAGHNAHAENPVAFADHVRAVIK